MADLLTLPVRSGHFILESGYHTDLWLTLDALFREPRAMAGAVTALADQLRAYDITAVCGPLLGGAFLAHAVATHLELGFYYTVPQQRRNTGALFDAQYGLPDALQRTAGTERFAVVDDAISAGSSVRATIKALRDIRAQILAVGSLLLLGDTGREYFEGTGMPLLSLDQREQNMWLPAECPLCAGGSTPEDPTQRN